MKILLLIVIGFLVFFSCGNIKINTSEGFAEIKSGNIYRAVSPEGLPFQVKWFRNYPEKNLTFWSEALKSHLLQEGYQFVSATTLEAGSQQVECLEWGAPNGGADYIYLTALMIKNDKIVFAEAAGEIALYQKYEEVLKSSLETMNLP